jgi:hypothetical protein
MKWSEARKMKSFTIDEGWSYLLFTGENDEFKTVISQSQSITTMIHDVILIFSSDSLAVLLLPPPTNPADAKLAQYQQKVFVLTSPP